ncbi:MAG: hypothetical protein JWO41_219 [Candidatus Saccharibacteria bacterium]|nr:hypothetical protein [Candidatus Saccharibacteria bacterium]
MEEQDQVADDAVVTAGAPAEAAAEDAPTEEVVADATETPEDEAEETVPPVEEAPEATPDAEGTDAGGDATSEEA